MEDLTSHGAGPTLRLKEHAGILEFETVQHTGGLFSWLHKSGPVGGTVTPGPWASSSLASCALLWEAEKEDFRTGLVLLIGSRKPGTPS